MAQLADVIVTLTLETEEFSRELRRVGQDLHNFSNQVRQTTSNMSREVNRNMEEMSESVREFNRSTRTTSEDVTRSTRNIERSYDSVSRSARRLSYTADTSLRGMRQMLVASTREFRNFGMAGRQVSQEVREQFSALPRHVQRYVQRLQEAGQSTAHFARLNEMYSARIIEAMRREHEYLQNKTTQSQRLMNSFAQNTHLSPLTNGFLGLANSMEHASRRGTALGIALQRVGENASLKQIRDEMNFVTQGIARARSALIGFGITAGLAIWGMTALAVAVDERVAPAFENLKATWVDAMEPFITTFANGLLNVMAFANAIGELVNKFSEAHPVIFSVVMSILMLTLVLGALLAPLAVTGIWAEGVAASFTALWAIIGPFVTGMLAVVGVALALATAIVLLYASIKELWKYSESFREAFISAWDAMKKAVLENFVTPVLNSWNNLKVALTDLIANVTGGTGTMADLWKWLGDILAVVINAISKVTLPIFSNAMTVLGSVVSGVIDLLVIAIKWMSEKWKEHGDEITAIVKKLWTYIEKAFTEVRDYLKSIMPQVTEIVKSAFELIKTAIGFTMEYIVPTVVNAFQWIWDKIGWIMPIIVFIIQDTWSNIKSLISNALSLIQNAISLFTNLLQGNWSGAWENVKAILKSALSLLWDWINLWILGKILGVFKSMGGKIKDALSDVAEMMSAPFKAGYEKIKGWVDKATGLISSFKNAVSNIGGAVVDFVTGGSGAGSGGTGGRSRSINANATGNVFTGASLLGGNQLVGEAGAEVVMPIERSRYMKPYASMVANLLDKERGSKRGEGIVQNITINSTTPLSPSEIARKNLQTARRLALEWEV